ncbi:hypothetical protein KC19_VG102700 [Ceratodon purpureus]|uniref:TF-B3 domain-containing protein n=1 Tax=Ceratodon purpureus TaxID=3225 RepID=A0A8T0HPJ7_CERPU|nr:hypothetical protein KC19_VG102700 [Ceratodon purpureus]
MADHRETEVRKELDHCGSVYFLLEILEANLYCLWILEFSRRTGWPGQEECALVTRMKANQEWTVPMLRLNFTHNLGLAHSIGAGWDKFMANNSIRPGDLLAFELVDDRCLVITIHPAEHGAVVNSPTPPAIGAVTPPSGLVFVGSKPTSKSPPIQEDVLPTHLAVGVATLPSREVLAGPKPRTKGLRARGDMVPSPSAKKARSLRYEVTQPRPRRDPRPQFTKTLRRTHMKAFNSARLDIPTSYWRAVGADEFDGRVYSLISPFQTIVVGSLVSSTDKQTFYFITNGWAEFVTKNEFGLGDTLLFIKVGAAEFAVTRV